ncbi:MAG TPA: hypothetical protein [Caudoviricetes sp.]|nr:MAG TPA: hypothetical protein [Caudoviricetes sp.]
MLGLLKQLTILTKRWAKKAVRLTLILFKLFMIPLIGQK